MSDQQPTRPTPSAGRPPSGGPGDIALVIGMILGAILIAVGGLVADDNPMISAGRFGDLEAKFNWDLFAPYAAGGCIVLMIGIGAWAVARAVARRG